MPTTDPRRVPAWVVLALAVGVLVLLWGLTRPDGDLAGSPPPVTPATSASQSGIGNRPPTPDSGLPTIAESALPREAVTTLALVRVGGPFPHEEDGGTFGNRERLLPRHESGYYREYTVETPGDDDRGPRRLVAGAGGDLYWTTDHYASFRQVEEGR
jgi:ribonuclease T1